LVELSDETGGNCLWPLAQVMKSGQSRVFPVKDIDGLPLGVAQQRLREAMVLPVTSRGEGGKVGLLVAGVSPARPLDAEYHTFYELVAGQIATAIQNARSAEEERARIEALAEIDRAKTAFFSNVSHEFRTPLTLMLGPVEDLLAKSHTGLSPAAKSQLELVNRNGSRLLRLVNTLLDFSRIEAGRMQAIYQPTDLAAFTIELASVFRSATEKAGLQLELDCTKLSEPVFVDRGMWEKIVLNLISNAFKFTFEGKIAVTLAQVAENVELRVRDTGVGIPERELPRLFDRFHRIENTRSRTHEGSGIGLALVQELVKLHHGTVRVQSVLGKGSTFIVGLSLGSAHLPADRIGGTRSLASTAMGAAPFVEEALRWLPDDALSATEPEILPGDELIPVPCPPLAGSDANGENRPTVLVADDNSDMRQYLVRLLGERYEVIAVPDGQAALASAQEHPPDLVLSDVMMPNLDGFGLLRELRAGPKTRTIPIIMLSARAGEESRVEGMERGADDYLIKPFSARELLARVQTHLQMARIRKRGEQDLRESEERATNIIESIADGFMVLDRDWRITYLNQRAEEIVSPLGKGRANLPGKVYWDEFPGTRGTIFEESYRRAVNEGVAVMLEAFYAPLDRWFDVRAYPGRDGLSLYFLDITERKLSERTPSLLASIVDSSDDAIISKNLDGMITSWNRAAESTFGYTAEEALGRHITLIIPPEQRAEEVKILERLRRGERIEQYETQRQRKDGTRFDISLTISPIRDGAGRIVGASKVARDITERKRAEERERRMAAEAVAATAKFRAVFEQTPVFAGIVALDGKVIDANRLCLDACGFRAEEVLGHYFWETGWWGHSKEVQAKIKAATMQAAQGTPFREILSYHWADGTERVVDFAVHPIVDHQGQILFLHPTGVDITDLKRAEENYRNLAETLDAEVRARTSEVVQQSEQLRDLSSRLMQAQDEERRRIARELHDSAGQILAALGMSLAQAAKYGNQDPARFTKCMDESQDLVQQLSQEIRTMSYLLHPPLLDETGLSEALGWYIQGLADRSGLEIALNIPEDFDRLPREMELVMFRLVQECLTNIHRHSGSKKAVIQIAREADSLALEVQDEGAGISQEKLAAIEKQGSGVGIRGMRERVRHVGGNMQIESNAGGTKITFTFPLTKPSAADAVGNDPQENSVQPIQIAG
jgi:PAS domain S-box-containing protein